jgi:hypothetical protein
VAAVDRSSLEELRDRAVAQHRIENGVVIAGTGLVQGVISLAMGGLNILTAGFAMVAITLGGRAIVAGKRRLRGRLPPARLLT